MMRTLLLLLSFAALSWVGCKSNQPVTESSPPEGPTDPRTALRNEEQIKTIYVEATKEMIRGEEAEAEKLYQEILDLDEGNHAARYNLAKLAFEDSRLDEAVAYARQAVAGAPDNYWYRHLLRRTYEERGDYNRAIEVQEQMLAQFPDQPEDRMHLASLYQREGQPRKALATLEELEKRRGFTPQVALRRYEILDRLGEREAALSVAQRLITFSPLETRFYQMAYQQLQALDRTDEAVQLLENLLANDPENGFALLSLADYYKSIDQFERSDQYLFKAFRNPEIPPEGKLDIIRGLMGYLDQEPSLRARVTRLIGIFNEVHPGNAGGYALQGQLLMAQGNLDEARNRYRQALELEPGNVGGWVDLIRLSLLARDYAAMLDDAEEARSYFPNQDQILFLYGFAAAREGRYRPAASALEKVLRMGTAEPPLQAQAYAELGYVYHQQGDYSASEENFDAALKLTPENPMILSNYAGLLAERRVKLDQAQQMAEAALKIAPNEAAFLDTYASVLMLQGDYKGARRQLEKALKAGPNPTVLEHYGDVLFQLGDEAAAEEQWQKAIEQGADIDLEEKKSGAH